MMDTTWIHPACKVRAKDEIQYIYMWFSWHRSAHLPACKAAVMLVPRSVGLKKLTILTIRPDAQFKRKIVALSASEQHQRCAQLWQNLRPTRLSSGPPSVSERLLRSENWEHRNDRREAQRLSVLILFRLGLSLRMEPTASKRPRLCVPFPQSSADQTLGHICRGDMRF